MIRKLNMRIDNVAMIGRQTLYIDPSNKELKKYMDVSSSLQADGYSENFWKSICRNQWMSVESFDASEFENATHIWDFNNRIPKEFIDKYSIVYDGGTLEHVFNYTRGLKNCLDMVKLGGYFISVTPANCNCGHGFYQLSPELLFSVLNKKNGFKVKEMTAIIEKLTPFGNIKTIYYHLRDNTTSGERLLLNTRHRTYLMVIAQKISSEFDGRDLIAQQSDYVKCWNDSLEMKKQHSQVNKLKDRKLKDMIKKNKTLYKLGVRILVRIENKRLSKFADKYNVDDEWDRL